MSKSYQLVFFMALFSLFSSYSMQAVDENSESVHYEKIVDYHFDKERKFYSEAKATCQSIGGKLFEPKSEKVYNEVSTLAKAKGISKYWMGIIDKTNEGQFTYDSDGGALCWTNWHKGEPNDWGKGEDCTRSGHGHNDVNKWNDSPCEREKYSVVCEKSVNETITVL